MKGKTKKVLLIDPPGSVVGLNTGLAYLAGILLENNFGVKILDFNNYKNNIDDRLKDALKNGYDVVGFSLKSLTVMNAIPLAKKCKKISPRIPLIAGGPGVTIEGKNFLKKYPIFDYALVGEGEFSFLDFLKFFNKEKRVEKVGGLVFKKGSRIFLNEGEFIQDLDRIPLPDYSVFDYIDFKRNNYPLVTSRGCPYNCSYCAVGLVSGKVFRAHSPKRVVHELELAKKKYQSKRFEIYDDTFTQDIERVKEICRLIIGKKLNLSWGCENGIRADRIDKELMKLMKKAGCQEIWLGIESFDPEVFALVNKGEKIEDILKTIKLAHHEGLKVSGFFIIGLPGSTYEKDLKTLEKAKKLGFQTTTWSLATPFPHTTFWDWAKKNARILRDYNRVSFFVDPKCTFETDDYMGKERLKMFYKANLAFHRYTCLTLEKTIFKQAVSVLKTIWQVDRPRLPTHLIYGVRAFLSSGIVKNYLRQFEKNLSIYLIDNFQRIVRL